MNSRERILAALNLEQPDRVPFADDVDREVRAKFMGRKDFDDLICMQSMGFDAIDYRGNDYYGPFFSQKKVIKGKEIYSDGLIKKEADLKYMQFPDPNNKSFYDPLKRFVDEYSKSDLATFVYVSWGVEGILYSMGMETFFYALFENMKLVKTLLEAYTEWNYRVMEHLNDTGVDFVVSYNNIAGNSGPLVSPASFRELFMPGLSKVAGVCRLPWVFHGDGNIMPLLDDLIKLGMNGIRPIQPNAMDLAEVKDKYGHRLCLWGNIDMDKVLARGTPADVEKEVQKAIEMGGAGGGYILGSSNSITGYCKTENIQAMARAVGKYGRY